MTGFDAALALLAERAQPLGTETIALDRAGRRVLAAPVLAAIDAPRHDSAAMDGFAVRAADTGARLRILGASYPAAPFAGSVGAGEAVRVTTGAPIPDGADQVRIVEDAAEDGGFVSFPGPPASRHHIRVRGSDFARGDTILAPGRTLDPRALLAAAAADAGSVSVWRRPRVSVLATGDEIVAPGQAATAPSPHAIPDSLSEAVLLLCHQWGAKPGDQHRARDDVAAIGEAASALLPKCDVLVLVGGASRGRRDFAQAALAPLGLALDFARLAIRPGKPVWYGRIGTRHILGLPGNPTAAMTVARLFLVPLLTGLAGRGAGLDWTPLPLAAAVPEGNGRERFLCGQREGDAVRVLDRQSAGAQALLARADLLVRLPGHGPALAAGTPVSTLRF